MKDKYQKPHTYNSKRDADRCIECGVDFLKGDLVFTDCVVNIHMGCLEAYGKTLRKLGLRQ